MRPGTPARTIDRVTTYLDHAATTPMTPAAREAMVEQLALTGNASSLHGPGRDARRVVLAGFAVGVASSLVAAGFDKTTLRIAIGSGTAFLVAQLVDVAVFDRLRFRSWWQAPFLSSLVGSAIDTALFIENGMASLLATLDDGEQIEVGIAGREGFVGLPLVFGDLLHMAAVGTCQRGLPGGELHPQRLGMAARLRRHLRGGNRRHRFLAAMAQRGGADQGGQGE